MPPDRWTGTGSPASQTTPGRSSPSRFRRASLSISAVLRAIQSRLRSISRSIVRSAVPGGTTTSVGFPAVTLIRRRRERADSRTAISMVCSRTASMRDCLGLLPVIPTGLRERRRKRSRGDRPAELVLRADERPAVGGSLLVVHVAAQRPHPKLEVLGETLGAAGIEEVEPLVLLEVVDCAIAVALDRHVAGVQAGEATVLLFRVVESDAAVAGRGHRVTVVGAAVIAGAVDVVVDGPGPTVVLEHAGILVVGEAEGGV